MNRAAHTAVCRRQKRLGVFLEQLGSELKISLPDGNGIFCEPAYACPEIGGHAIGLSAEQNHTDNPRKMKSAQGDIRYRQHQRAVFKAALYPYILLWKRIASVPFDIAYSLFKMKLLIAHRDLSVDSVRHTVNAMTALHERNKSKWSHNVIANG